jgi:hypothetical protein
VADYAVGDEIAGAGGDIEEGHRTNGLNGNDACGSGAFESQSLHVLFTGDGRGCLVEESQMLLQAAEYTDDLNRASAIARDVFHDCADTQSA